MVIRVWFWGLEGFAKFHQPGVELQFVFLHVGNTQLEIDASLVVDTEVDDAAALQERGILADQENRLSRRCFDDRGDILLPGAAGNEDDVAGNPVSHFLDLDDLQRFRFGNGPPAGFLDMVRLKRIGAIDPNDHVLLIHRTRILDVLGQVQNVRKLDQLSPLLIDNLSLLCLGHRRQKQR